MIWLWKKINDEFDLFVYRLFYWRWNDKLKQDEHMRAYFIVWVEQLKDYKPLHPEFRSFAEEFINKRKEK